MKIPIEELNLDIAKKLRIKNEWSDHFKLVVWPRILFWLGMKELFVDNEQLSWKIHYTPDNMHNNFISMHIVDEKEVFNFYFQVPLVERLSFNLYLGDNTYNFFEIHPVLIANGIIKKDEVEIGATSTVLPHLVLTTSNSKYDKKILWDIHEENYAKLVQHDAIINLLNANFIKFIPPLRRIIDNEWKI